MQALIREAAARRNGGEVGRAENLRKPGPRGWVVHGVPAVELLARHARCATLEELGDTRIIRKPVPATHARRHLQRRSLSTGLRVYVSETQRSSADAPKPVGHGRGRVRAGLSTRTVFWQDWRRDPASTGAAAKVLAIGTDTVVLIARPRRRALRWCTARPGKCGTRPAGRCPSPRHQVWHSVSAGWTEGPPVVWPRHRAKRYARGSAASEAGLPGPSTRGRDRVPNRSLVILSRQLMLASALVVGTCVTLGVRFDSRAVHIASWRLLD